MEKTTTTTNFHSFLEANLEWKDLSAQRDKARKIWQDRSNKSISFIYAAHYMQAAEILEDRTVMHYQCCMDEDASNAIHKWTGIHPEMSVEIYADIIKFLQNKASTICQEANEYISETRHLEKEYEKAQDKVSKLYDILREEYNKITAETNPEV